MDQFYGSEYFRQRLILATLSGKSIQISKIRLKEEHPGLVDYEVSFLQLLEALTNGTSIAIDETGTQVTYRPGLLTGGDVVLDCPPSRSVSYYLEAILFLAAFVKKPLNVVLRGITNDDVDPSVDSIKHASLPVLQKFLGTDEGLELKISKRGLSPNGGGEVHFSCPCRLKLRPFQQKDAGIIKSIRGVAYACKVSPTMGNRVGEAAKSKLKEFVADIYVYTDHCKGPKSGLSPGFGITLIAESTTGVRYAIDVASSVPGSGRPPSVPEDLGEKAADLLLEEIYRGGCVGMVNQSLALLLMALGQSDVSKVEMGSLSPFSIQFLRYLRDFFGVVFRISQETDGAKSDGCAIFTCVGIGYSNINKTVA
ncbi:RNA 3'-terminal phosphate cyclase-like protein [Paramacrobiotus metropolitanus]|uniref:RNA 3'-terminal phosphate cyclase-like protein n=1 Tax=Paramacrobiotus metropolitanus TaxID=2943436 RepID=UPI002445E9EA|nr:RNA 3'-terminal phosphate cyclase-like protein [Paramacrobiotus metropolitanus]